jgi:hypothetical protein
MREYVPTADADFQFLLNEALFEVARPSASEEKCPGRPYSELPPMLSTEEEEPRERS